MVDLGRGISSKKRFLFPRNSSGMTAMPCELFANDGHVRAVDLLQCVRDEKSTQLLRGYDKPLYLRIPIRIFLNAEFSRFMSFTASALPPVFPVAFFAR